MDFNAIEGIYIGYDLASNSHKIFNLKSKIITFSVNCEIIEPELEELIKVKKKVRDSVTRSYTKVSAKSIDKTVEGRRLIPENLVTNQNKTIPVIIQKIDPEI